MIAVESKFLNPSLLFGNTAIERFEKKKIPKSFGNIFGFLDHLPRNKSKALRWCSTGMKTEMGQSCCYLLSKRFFCVGPVLVGHDFRSNFLRDFLSLPLDLSKPKRNTKWKTQKQSERQRKREHHQNDVLKVLEVV